MLNGATLGLMAAVVAGTINAATVNTNNSGFSSATCKNGFGTPFYVNINNSQCLRTASVGQTCQVTCALGFSASPASSTYSCQRYTQGMPLVARSSLALLLNPDVVTALKCHGILSL